ncbi:MAG: hypothetical protein ACJA1F_002944, partial [Paracoccaceae bacterium]
KPPPITPACRGRGAGPHGGRATPNILVTQARVPKWREPPDPNCNIQGNIVEKMTVLLKHLFNGR